MNTAAATTTTRTTIDAMWTLTIACRWDTCIDGRIKYQCPSTIAVHAPPSSAAELRKLATVSARVGGVQLADTTSACRTIAMAPAKTAAARIAVRMRVNMRPIVAQ